MNQSSSSLLPRLISWLWIESVNGEGTVYGGFCPKQHIFYAQLEW